MPLSTVVMYVKNIMVCIYCDVLFHPFIFFEIGIIGIVFGNNGYSAEEVGHAQRLRHCFADAAVA